MLPPHTRKYVEAVCDLCEQYGYTPAQVMALSPFWFSVLKSRLEMYQARDALNTTMGIAAVFGRESLERLTAMAFHNDTSDVGSYTDENRDLASMLGGLK